MNALTTSDEANLRSLAIAYRIAGGLLGLGLALAGVGWACFSVFMSKQPPGGVTGDPEVPMMQYQSGVLLGSVLAVVGVVFLVLSFWAASSFQNRKNYWLCFGVAIYALLYQPIGLVLGILTIIVLVRPSVKEAFRTS